MLRMPNKKDYIIIYYFGMSNFDFNYALDAAMDSKIR